MIIAVVGQKGGVGKSTVAVCLGVCATERGYNTLLVDADPQGTVRTWSAVAAENRLPAPTLAVMGADMHREGRLTGVAERFDCTIIDCPPSHGEVQRSALMVADVALLPCGQSGNDVWALTSSLDLVREARELRPSLGAAIVITRKQARTALGREARSALAPAGMSVLRAELSYRVAYQEAMARGAGVTSRRRDPAAREVQDLFDEVEAFSRAQKDRGGFSPQAAASA